MLERMLMAPICFNNLKSTSAVCVSGFPFLLVGGCCAVFYSSVKKKEI